MGPSDWATSKFNNVNFTEEIKEVGFISTSELSEDEKMFKIPFSCCKYSSFDCDKEVHPKNIPKAIFSEVIFRSTI